MSTVAERFWTEILDVSRPLAQPERSRAIRRTRVLVRTHRSSRPRTR